MAENLQKDGLDAEVIHGNKAQNARQRALDAFRAGRVRVLVATDIVARGIDVPGITHIVNYDLPDEAESYVHRIGRTGRNGAAGIAVTLCAPDEVEKLRAVEKITRTRLLSADVRGEPAQPRKPQGRPQRSGGGKPAQASRSSQAAAHAGAGDGKPGGSAAAAGGRGSPGRPERRGLTQRPRGVSAPDRPVGAVDLALVDPARGILSAGETRKRRRRDIQGGIHP